MSATATPMGPFAPHRDHPEAGETSQLHQFSEALGNAVDARDPNTFRHSAEVAGVSRILAMALGLTTEQSRLVHLAGHLHDIGKIGIPDQVLQKAGPLTTEEWTWMRQHPSIGANILRPVAAFDGSHGVADMVLCHHERFDGRGYPCCLKGEEIPLGARIIAVADTLSALMQDRPYRQSTDFCSALSEIRRGSGSQFDPGVIRALDIMVGGIRNFMLAKSRVGNGKEPGLAPEAQVGTPHLILGLS